MSIEKIANKIIEDANSKAEKMVGQAKEEAKNILLKSKEDALSNAKEIELNANKQNEDALEKNKNFAVLEGRKLLLKAKQDCISNVCELALQKMEGFSTEEYFGYIKNLLLKIPVDQKAELILNKKDKARIPAEKISEINPFISISDQDGQFRAGFILSFADAEYNCSFEELLKGTVESNKKEIAEILFH